MTHLALYVELIGIGVILIGEVVALIIIDMIDKKKRKGK